MKSILALSAVVLGMSACNNMPEQQLYTCVETYTAAQQIPPANVPPPVEQTAQSDMSSGECLCHLPQVSQGLGQSASQQPTQVIPAGHVCPLIPRTPTCPPATTAPQCQCQCHCQYRTQTAIPEQKSAAEICHFDAGPIEPNMSPTEKLNRTR